MSLLLRAVHWFLHGEKEGNIFSWILMSKLSRNRLGIQFVPSTAVALAISNRFTPGSGECSQHMPVSTKRRQRATQRGAKSRASRSGVRGANRMQSMFCNSKGAKAKRQAEWGEKTAIVKLLCHAILKLARQRLQHFANVCQPSKAPFSMHLSPIPQALSSLYMSQKSILNENKCM